MMYVVEYSPTQGCFHIDTLDRILELNRSAVQQGKNPGYLPLALCNSNEEAKAFAAQWERLL